MQEGNQLQTESLLQQSINNETVLQEYYSRYLKNVRGLSDSSVKHYFDALNNISRRLKAANLVKESIYEISELDRLAELKEILYSDDDFIEQDRRGRRMYSAGLNNYCRFAQGEGFTEAKGKIAIMDIPVEAEEAVDRSSKLWRRSSIIRGQALEIAGYSCEIDNSHESFIAEKNHHPYMEGHHAIPMSRQDRFHNSLDVYANIVCLCPLCHRRIHYGIREDRVRMLNQIYDSRANRLYNCGIRLSKEEFSNVVL